MRQVNSDNITFRLLLWITVGPVGEKVIISGSLGNQVFFGIGYIKMRLYNKLRYNVWNAALKLVQMCLSHSSSSALFA